MLSQFRGCAIQPLSFSKPEVFAILIFPPLMILIGSTLPTTPSSREHCKVLSSIAACSFNLLNFCLCTLKLPIHIGKPSNVLLLGTPSLFLPVCFPIPVYVLSLRCRVIFISTVVLFHQISVTIISGIKAIHAWWIAQLAEFQFSAFWSRFRVGF